MSELYSIPVEQANDIDQLIINLMKECEVDKNFEKNVKSLLKLKKINNNFINKNLLNTIDKTIYNNNKYLFDFKL